MTHGELVTAVRYGLAVKVIVARNGAYGLERDKAAQASLNPVGLELQAPDFRRYAESCGVAGFRVEDPADVGPALARAFALPGPALVEVVCADVRLPFPAPRG
jgi:thiamine pyrophosphate-dependent acetolactate synthase large subunit-like protein